MNQIYHIKHSDHLQGFVASTGNSALAAVLENLKTFGGKGYFSPRAEHQQYLNSKYWAERDRLHWEETGHHLPRRADGGTKENNKPKARHLRVPARCLVLID